MRANFFHDYYIDITYLVTVAGVLVLGSIVAIEFT
jgi:hypothetical protein